MTTPVHLNAMQLLTRSRIADKAIVCMAILHCDNETGVGPNRDDAPIFASIAEKTLRGATVPKDLAFRGRHRVRKYVRQLTRCRFADYVFGDAPIDDVASVFEAAEKQRQSAAQLKTEIQAITTMVDQYGAW